MKKYEKISPTALICMEARARYTDIPYAKEVRNALGDIEIPYAESLESIASNEPDRLIPLELSPLGIIEQIHRLGTPVIEIASGLSPIGLTISENLPYIETDLPEMISLKEKLVKQIKPKHDHYFFPLNITEPKQFNAFIQNLPPEFQNTPITIVNEGLLMYFSDKEKQITRDNLSKLILSGSYWVSSDFSARDSYHKDQEQTYKTMQKIKQSTGREFNRFKTDEQVNQFLSAEDLEGICLENTHLINELSCLGILEISEEQATEICGFSRPWIIA